MATDRTRERSNALSAIRIVSNVAKDALQTLSKPEGSEVRHFSAGMDGDEYVAGYSEHYHDPDEAEMRAVLEEFIQKSERWTSKGRAGRPRG